MPDSEPGLYLPPPVVAIVGWLLPGAGYVAIGHRAKGLVVGVAIVVLYVAGLLLAGVRVIEVPGYGRWGYRLQVVVHETQSGFIETTVVDPRNAREDANPAPGIDEHVIGWALWQRPLTEIANKPWFVGQVLAGPLCLISAAASNYAASQGVSRPHAALETIGTLYTAVAGMLNLLVIIDSTHRASRHKEDHA